jgi:hypothetical protein
MTTSSTPPRQHTGRHRNKRRERWAKPSTPRRLPKLAVVEAVPMNRLRLGVVVWAHVPFRDDDGEKTRPAIVVRTAGRTVELLPVTTSQARFRRPHQHVEICDLDTAGLDRPSAVQLRTITVDRIELIHIVGELSDADLDAVTARLEHQVSA